MSNDTAMLLLLSMAVGMMAAETGAYRGLGWEWGGALKAVASSQVTGLGAGILLVVLFESSFLRHSSRPVLVALVGLGAGAIACGAPLVAWMAPEEFQARSVLLVSSVVKVLLLVTGLAGLFFATQFQKAARPLPTLDEQQLQPRPHRTLKDFSQNASMY